VTVRRDFLVEIGTEELPPKSLLQLASSFADGIAQGLDAASLAHGTVERFATPRRLAVRVRRLVERQPDRAIEKRGPPVKAAFDTQGAPTQAALAFARGCRVEVGALQRIETPKGEWLVYRGSEAGADTVALMPDIVRTALDGLPIARRMRWGAGTVEFVRPVHWVAMLFGKDVVDAEVLGLRAGNLTYGHRFMSPKPIRLSSPSAYVTALERRGRVLADIHARRESIRQGVAAAASRSTLCSRSPSHSASHGARISRSTTAVATHSARIGRKRSPPARPSAAGEPAATSSAVHHLPRSSGSTSSSASSQSPSGSSGKPSRRRARTTGSPSAR